MKTYVKHIQCRFDNLIKFDNVRLSQILEILQYSFLYAFVAGFAGILLEKIFPYPDNNKSTNTILLEILLQCMLSALSVFYLRKVVKVVPFILEEGRYYKKHGVDEYNGEIMIAIVFVGMQKNLLTKIDTIRSRLI